MPNPNLKVFRRAKRRTDPLSILIAGSLAKTKFVRGISDLDLILIVEKVPDYRFTLKAIKDVNIEVFIYTLEEFLKSIKGGNQFMIDY
ncbi:MAG: hypothetical protein QXX95_07245 [Nitrososphaerales archaeon]